MSDGRETLAPTLRLLAVMEPKTVTGAGKNMLDFVSYARDFRESLPAGIKIETCIVTFERSRSSDSAAQTPTPAADEQPNEFVRAARELGIEVEILPERFRFDLRVVPLLREIVERRRPDIILTHHVKSHFLLKLSGLWKRYPWVAFHHGYTKTLRRERLYNQLDRLSLPTAHRVVTVCQAFADELKGAGVSRERLHVQHNSIRPEQRASEDEVRAVRARLGVLEDEQIVLAIGRLSKEKAHIDLIKSFDELSVVNPALKARLVIVGDGPERAGLETAAASLGLAERVIFAGQQSRVQPYYAAASVLALPSHSEGSPYVLLEAMAAELPIVATKVGGVGEMIEDELSGLLVAPRSPRAMAEALARVLMNSQLARELTANASTLIATRYSPETYLNSLLGIYRALIPSPAALQSQPDI